MQDNDCRNNGDAYEIPKHFYKIQKMPRKRKGGVLWRLNTRKKGSGISVSKAEYARNKAYRLKRKKQLAHIGREREAARIKQAVYIPYGGSLKKGKKKKRAGCCLTIDVNDMHVNQHARRKLTAGAGFTGVRRSKISYRRHKNRGGFFFLPLIGSLIAGGVAASQAR